MQAMTVISTSSSGAFSEATVFESIRLLAFSCPTSVTINPTVGAAAEKADVALYDRLLKTVTESDIVTVMQQQRKVSLENHLPAFERC